MKRFVVVDDEIKLENGNVYLTGFQYQPRAHKLERISPGLGKFGEYKIVEPIEFLRDEIIGFDGEVKSGLKELQRGDKIAEHIPVKEDVEIKTEDPEIISELIDENTTDISQEIEEPKPVRKKRGPKPRFKRR